MADQDPLAPLGTSERPAWPRTGPVLTLVGIVMFATSASACALTPGLVDRPSLQPAYTVLVMLSLGGAALTVIGLVLAMVELVTGTLRRR